MKIEIWSDIMCPFCYLGDQNLKDAIKEYKGNEAIEIEYKAFQLNPSQPKEATPDNPINYTLKKGLPKERVEASFNHITNEAKQLNLPINIEQAKVVNSLDALRFVKWAQNKGKLHEVKDRLFRGYFAQGKDLSNQETLINIGKELGFNEDELTAFFNSDLYNTEVTSDRQEGIQKGLQGVPFFVVNNTYALAGNQPKENFLNLFEKINPTQTNGNSCDIETGICN